MEGVGGGTGERIGNGYMVGRGGGGLLGRVA